MKNFSQSVPLFALACACVACQPLAAPPQKAPQPTPVTVTTNTPETTTSETGDISTISIDRLAMMKMKDEVVMIDTRPGIFYSMGHVSGAISIPLKHVDKVFVLKKDVIDAAVKDGKHLVVYCANSNCKDSHKMAQWLAAKNYDVSVFEGGWELWKQAGIE